MLIGKFLFLSWIMFNGVGIAVITDQKNCAEYQGATPSETDCFAGTGKAPE